MLQFTIEEWIAIVLSFIARQCHCSYCILYCYSGVEATIITTKKVFTLPLLLKMWRFNRQRNDHARPPNMCLHNGKNYNK